jgi:hypothetical protein
MHPVFLYRGVAFPTPKGWIQDEDAIDQRIEKPSSVYYHGEIVPASSLSITWNDASPRRTPQDLLKHYNKLQSLIAPSAKPTEFMATDPQGQPVRVKCNNIGMGIDCISMDARWTFLFMGKPSAFTDSIEMMRTVVARNVPTLPREPPPELP